MDKIIPEKTGSFARRSDDDPKPDPDHNSPKPDLKVGAGNTSGEREIEEVAAEEIPLSISSVSVEMDKFLTTLSAAGDGKGNPSAEILIPDDVHKFLDLVEAQIAKFDLGESREKWSENPDQDSWLLESINGLSKMRFLLYKSKLDTKYDIVLNRIGGIHHRAMLFLEDEFRSLLDTNFDSDSAPGNETSSDESFPGYPEDIVCNLHRIAKEMIFGGYEFECLVVYVNSRRNVIEESFQKLGLEKNSFDDVQKMQWEALEREIVNWIKVFKHCTTVYFSGELKLVTTIFSNSQSIITTLVNNFTRDILLEFINFAESVTVAKRSSEKLFKYLDMYETLRDSDPAIAVMVSEELANDIKAEISLARSRFGETVILIFSEMENSIMSDTGKTTVPGGAVHPLTRYIMNYLKYACEYSDTLEQIFRQHSKIERANSTSRSERQSYNSNNNNQPESESPFQVQLIRIMELLDTNLEAKSKLYKDISLSSIFLMNNGRYILQKIKGSPEINNSMGTTWLRKKSSEIRNYHKAYQRETWTKLLGFLSHEGLMVNGKVPKPVLKERFKGFNAMFDEIHKTQSSWIVSDEQLQSELRVSISAVVIPAYRSFLGRFAQIFDPGRQTEKYVKFQPEDIETYIEELFDGNASPMARRKI